VPVTITKIAGISTLLHFSSLHFRAYVRIGPTIASSLFHSLFLEMANAAQLKKRKGGRDELKSYYPL
jgi:hypothetical protein